MSKEIIIHVTPNDSPARLDIFLVQKLPAVSRNYIQHLIDQKKVFLNGKPVKPSHKIGQGNVIQVTLPDPEPLDTEPENIALDVVYEDEQLLVINKPAGMVIHPAGGVSHGTLVNALLYHCKELSGIGGVQRPGIVHRLDKGTSGLIMAAKTDLAHRSLSNQLKERTIERKYLALVYGRVKQNEGFIETLIGRHRIERKKMAVLKEGGRRAGTFYKVLQRFPLNMSFPHKRESSFSLIECKLTTGRTHQIRVHLSYLGHPVVGDMTYGKGKTVGLGKEIKNLIAGLNGFALHAKVLGFHHPVTNKYLEFSVDPPDAFGNLIAYLSKP